MNRLWIVAFLLHGCAAGSGVALVAGHASTADTAEEARYYSATRNDSIEAALQRANRNWERIEARLRAIENVLGIDPEESVATR